MQLAFFGGNFLGLAEKQMARLLHTAHDLVKEGKVQELRCSTRPDTITPALLEQVRAAGMTTIELGVQSMDNEVLRQARRGHTREDTCQAARLLKAAGLYMGMQMMVGLPGDTARTAMATAKAICDMAPDFVRIYPLIVLKGSPLARQYAKGHYTPLALADCVGLVKEIYTLFTDGNIPVIRMGTAGIGSAPGSGHPGGRPLASGFRASGLFPAAPGQEPGKTFSPLS